MSNNCISTLSKFVVEEGVVGVISYGAVALFATVNPIPCAISCIAGNVISKLVDPVVINSTFEAKLIGAMFKTAIKLGLSVGIMYLIGIPVTLPLSGVIFGAFVATQVALAMINQCNYQSTAHCNVYSRRTSTYRY